MGRINPQNQEERKKAAALIADGNIQKLFDGLQLAEEERAFAHDHGQTLCKEIISKYGEAVKRQGKKVRPVAMSAALSFAMIAIEAFGKDRGQH